MIGRILSKAQNTTLSLGQLTTRHLVPRLHCNLVACQQLAHATYCIHTIGER
jgi:hypothetical protein